jgi:hypothetical protein
LWRRQRDLERRFLCRGALAPDVSPDDHVTNIGSRSRYTRGKVGGRLLNSKEPSRIQYDRSIKHYAIPIRTAGVRTDTIVKHGNTAVFNREEIILALSNPQWVLPRPGGTGIIERRVELRTCTAP